MNTATEQQPHEASGTGPGEQANTSETTSCMRIVIDISSDTITETVIMQMGMHHDSLSKRWMRVSANSFKARDCDFAMLEARFGVEAVDYMACLDLPIRLANMLPRRKASPESVARVARFVDALGKASDEVQP